MKNRGLRHRPARAYPKIAALFLLGLMPALWAGCPTSHTAGVNSSSPNRINEIQVSEDDQAWYCTIKGIGTLTFTALNQVDPAGLLLYFPDTALDADRAVVISPDNEIIKSIEADEVLDGNLKDSRILIVTQVERPYAFSPDPDGVRVSFPKTTARPTDTGDSNGDTAGEPETGRREPGAAAATVLETVTAATLEDHSIITVNADGTIGNYKTFAIENPARIVFDLFSLKSAYEQEQIIPVGSRWVKQIRYFAYPDKIRMVLDTEPEFLTQYFSFSTASGLLIYIGRLPEPLVKTR
jgi:type IV pilus assembly protein PilQ